MFELKKLTYAYDALEPVIDKETMEIHHSKHHQAYVDNLNKALNGLEEFSDKCACFVLKNLDKIPSDKLAAVRNNAGGVYNHNMLWDILTPGGAKLPVGSLATKIDETFGSFEKFKEEFETKGLARFGSGWVWLVEKDGKLEVISTANQDNPISEGYKVIMGNDVWEHAYYLKHQNKRAAYLKAFWDVVNWDKVLERFEK